MGIVSLRTANMPRKAIQDGSISCEQSALSAGWEQPFLQCFLASEIFCCLHAHGKAVVNFVSSKKQLIFRGLLLDSGGCANPAGQLKAKAECFDCAEVLDNGSNDRWFDEVTPVHQSPCLCLLILDQRATSACLDYDSLTLRGNQAS